MRKKAGIVLCIIGVVLVAIAGIIMLIAPVHQDNYTGDNEDRTELTQDVTEEEQSAVTTEYQEEEKQKTGDAQADSNTANNIQSSKKQSAHDINPEVYEWSCGNTFYQNREEPELVVEFAKYKEYYEQIVQEFLEYEGKDVYFYANEDKLHFDECSNEGSVKVNCDNEKVKGLLEKGKIDSISVESDYIIFHTDINEWEMIMYLYDETLTYNDSFPSIEGSLISDYWMVDIAPHWWWETTAKKGI